MARLDDVKPIDHFAKYDDPDRNAVEDVDIMQAQHENAARRAAQQAAQQNVELSQNRQAVVMPAGLRPPAGATSEVRTGRFVTQKDFDEGNAAVEAYKRAHPMREGRVSSNRYRGDSWDRALQQQKSARAAESTRKAMAHTNDFVNANREEMKQIDERKAEAKRNRTLSDLSLFDAYAAAYDDMKSKIGENGEVADGKIFEPTRVGDEQAVVNGVAQVGQDGKPVMRSSMWNYDETTGKILGQRDADKQVRVKTGKRFVTGFVSPANLAALNDTMFQRGVTDSKVVGMMVQQAVDANGRPTGKPMFRVRRRMGDGSVVSETHSLEDIYRFGVKSYKDDGAEDAEDRVINSPIGDVLKVRENRKPSEKMQIAKMQNDTKKEIAADANKTRLAVTEINAALKKMGIEVDKNKLEELIRSHKANESNAAAKTRADVLTASLDKGRGELKETAQSKAKEMLENPPVPEAPAEETPAAGTGDAGTGGEAQGVQPPAGTNQGGGDEDIKLPDGSAGKKHNGKTYRLKGVDANGNRQWELVK